MLELVAESVVAVAVAAPAALVAARRWIARARRRRHAACLRSIAQLERDVFPHLALYVSDDAAYPSVTASLHKLRIEMATFGLLESGALPELTAGAIWVVDDPQCVELLPEIDR